MSLWTEARGQMDARDSTLLSWPAALVSRSPTSPPEVGQRVLELALVACASPGCWLWEKLEFPLEGCLLMLISTLSLC